MLKKLFTTAASNKTFNILAKKTKADMQFEQAGQFIINKLRTEVPAQFTYHNIEHTLDVRQAAEQISKQEDITDDELQLLLTAALFHDSGFLKCAKGHEAESCRIAREILPAYDYNATEIDLICDMIMATQLPQTPKTHLEQILADADLDYLGRNDFFVIGGKLYHELTLVDAISDELEWNYSQLDFMEKHRYFTKTAINLRRPKKLDNIAKIKALLLNKNIK